MRQWLLKGNASRVVFRKDFSYSVFAIEPSGRRSVANLRVVEGERSSTGHWLEVGPFPGWEKVPEW